MTQPKLSLKSVLILISLILITLGFSLFNPLLRTLAQQSIPLPANAPRAETELLSNGGFENDADSDKIPDTWTPLNLTLGTSDKRKCDQPGTPVAHSGTCAFMFRGSPGVSSKIQQNLTDLSGFVNGVNLVFSAYIDPRSGLVGAAFGKVNLTLSDNTKSKLILLIPAAAGRALGDYQLIGDNQVLDLVGQTVTKAKVLFRYTGASGKFLIDDVSLKLVVAEPTSTPSATPSTTSTPFMTDTPRDTETPLPTDTATFTPSATFTATATPTDTATTTHTATATLTATNTPIPAPFKLVASDGATGDFLGNAVALDGDTLVVGASSSNDAGGGAAYVFVRTGATWTQQAKLTASDGAANDFFAVSVAVDGDTAVVGAYGSNNLKGAAYVFTRSGTTWTQQQKLVASDGAASDSFGTSVTIVGDTIVVGATLGDLTVGDNHGAAYVFTRSGTTWTQQTKVTADDGAAIDLFGYALMLDGSTLVVGSINSDVDGKTNQGAAYVFVGSGASWTQQAKLTALDGAANDAMGNSVAVSGDSAIISAHADDAVQGAAYVFTRSGTVWTQQQKLVASDGAANDRFGYGVAISGNIAVAGAYLDDIGGATDQGSAYVFTRSGTLWTQQPKLTASDGSAFEYYGLAVALQGKTLAVAAYADQIGANVNQGSVWVIGLP